MLDEPVERVGIVGHDGTDNDEYPDSRRIAADSAGVLYEWRVAGCAGTPDQHEVARIIEGRDARARVAYTRKGAPMSDSVRAGWVDRLGKARFRTSRAR